MATKIPIVICIILIPSATVTYLTNNYIVKTGFVQQTPEHYRWIVHGVINILGYMTLFLPGYLIYKYITNTNYLKTGESGFCLNILQKCFAEDELTSNIGNSESLFQRTTCEEVFLILFHFFGLQISYLTWGVLQEKVMTQKYQSDEGGTTYFTDSQFLVFVNRILAFCIAGVYIFYKKQTRHKCPLYKYSFCSFSNIMSSWCQYEALKYVSFPHQVLTKAAKTIPVMIMGKVLHNTKYEYYEYVTSFILSVGMLLFMLNVENEHVKSVITTFSGFILLVFYIIFDSFTSNWQGALFKTYNIKPVQMMCFVNLFSCLLTAVSLSQQGSFLSSLNFMLKYPQFAVDCFILSICSVTGQLFIFSTISKFGPLIFAIIMTVRQGFSVLLSCIIYNHHLNAAGIFGVILVFLSVFLRIYCGHRRRSIIKNKTVKSQRISV